VPRSRCSCVTGGKRVVLAGEALKVTIDPVQASLEGMTTPGCFPPRSRLYLSGNVAPVDAEPLKTVGIRGLVESALRRRDDDVRNLRSRLRRTSFRLDRCRHDPAGRLARAGPSATCSRRCRSDGAHREAGDRARPSRTSEEAGERGLIPAGVPNELGAAATSRRRALSGDWQGGSRRRSSPR